jgi:hypothetical protein
MQYDPLMNNEAPSMTRQFQWMVAKYEDETGFEHRLSEDRCENLMTGGMKPRAGVGLEVSSGAPHDRPSGTATKAKPIKLPSGSAPVPPVIAPMTTKFRYIECKPRGDQWMCFSTSKPVQLLGTVQMYFPWRQWQFCPESYTAFTVDCLRDIAEFIAQLPKPARH